MVCRQFKIFHLCLDVRALDCMLFWRVCLARAKSPVAACKLGGMMKVRSTFLVATTLALSLFAGCKRDPQVQKKNYVDKGFAYFQQSKYREAAIEYQNALQIDPRFAEAHLG